MNAKELVELCDAAGQKRAKCTCGREYPSSHDVDCREAGTVLAIYNARASLHKLGFKDEPDGDARARQYAALLEALEYCEAASNQPHVFKYAAAALEKAKGAVLAIEVKS